MKAYILLLFEPFEQSWLARANRFFPDDFGARACTQDPAADSAAPIARVAASAESASTAAAASATRFLLDIACTNLLIRSLPVAVDLSVVLGTADSPTPSEARASSAIESRISSPSCVLSR